MKILVQKFGGTSLADFNRLKHVASLIKAARAEGYAVLVVVSSMGSTTDQLIDQVGSLNSPLTAREMASFLVTGEMQSAALLAMTLAQSDIAAQSCSAAQINLRAEGRYEHAHLKSVDVQRLQSILEKGVVPIVCGFQALNDQNEWVTLGRSGSDTTAVFLASQLLAARCDIYTDVCGVMSADPRKISHPRQITQMPLLSMLEFAKRGAQVLHLDSIKKAIESDVCLRVRSSFENSMGTRLSTDVPDDIQHYGVVHETGFAQWVSRVKLQGDHGTMIHHACADGHYYTGKHSEVLWLGEKYSKARIAPISQLDKITIVGVHLKQDIGLAHWLEECARITARCVQIEDFAFSIYVDHTQGDRVFKEVHAGVNNGFYVREIGD